MVIQKVLFFLSHYMSSLPKHLLIFRLSAMGDVAMTVPIIKTLVHQFPDVRITVVSRPFFKPLFEDIPNTFFFPVDVKNKHKGFLGLLRLFKELKKLKIDAMADLHHVLRSNIIRQLFKWNGVLTAATDKGRKEKKELTRLTHKNIQPLKTMFERHAETFSKLGFSLDLNQIPTSTKKELPLNIIEFTGIKNEKWIGIAPFAQYESKVYPLDLMQKMVNQLTKNQSHKILLFGGGSQEIEKLKILQNNHPQIQVVAGVFSFADELILIQHLDLMISMDSGNGHLASIYDIPVITIWGATHPFAGFTPFNQPISNSILPDLKKYPWIPTSVYGNKKVIGYEDAMRSILPENIVEKAIEMLSFN